MEIVARKLCHRLLQGRCVIPTTQCSSAMNFIRNEHMGMKVKEAQEEKQVVPNKLSTLYVPGRYGGKMYQIVKPIIDINCIEESFDKIEQSCQLRGIELDCENDNFTSLLKDWESHKTVYENLVLQDREYLEEKNRLKSLNLTGELENLMREHGAFIDKLKEAKDKLHNLEDVVMPLIQKIPNSVSDSTPIGDDVVEASVGIPDLGYEAASHVVIGESMSVLEFSQISPSAYYLTGKLAELELAVQEYFTSKFRDLDYAPLSCTDFCKSFIIEAIGLDPYSTDDCITLMPKDVRDVGQKLNLVGGASFATFCAYLTNMNIAESSLPLKYFSLGRCYTARNRKNKSMDLFSVVQSTNIHSLVLCKDNNLGLEFAAHFDTLVSLYKALKIPFRIVSVGVRNLNATERRKKQIELWSPASQMYIPVCWVSERGDFVSKRLHVSFGEEYKVQGYCSMLEGVAANIPVLIACIVENFQTQNRTFNFPEVLGSCC